MTLTHLFKAQAIAAGYGQYNDVLACHRNGLLQDLYWLTEV